MSVLFATKTWEKDWQVMLAGGFDRKAGACAFPFDHKILIANNGVPDGAFEPYFGAIYVKDERQEVLDYFRLEDANLYAIGELTAIYSAKNYDYLVYVQGDCITQGDWIEEGIKILEKNPQVSVVSPASDVNTWHSADGYDHYMSDQAFIVRVAEFRDPEIYKYPGTDPDYPDYGGDSFEHMVGKYLKATGKQRKIIEDAWVSHPAY